jgi:glycosyltransferase involved in cell wall biosynthesis
VRKAHPQARFQLLGPFDPNPAGIGAEQVERWHRDGVVDYLGATRDVRPYLAGCTVYVLPSYREGVPRTVLEAMAVGRPIITTDAPGCRETVIDGESGFLVPPRDPAALAATMLRFCKEPALARVMAERAHVRARAKFDVEAINARMLDLLLSPQPRDLRAPQSVQLSSGQGADWRRARSG